VLQEGGSDWGYGFSQIRSGEWAAVALIRLVDPSGKGLKWVLGLGPAKGT
jgi:hypothetical protein